jgi:hypothetical protein
MQNGYSLKRRATTERLLSDTTETLEHVGLGRPLQTGGPPQTLTQGGGDAEFGEAPTPLRC